MKKLNSLPLFLPTFFFALLQLPTPAAGAVALPPGSKKWPPTGPVQEGAPVDDCYVWMKARPGDTCDIVCDLLDLTVDQFLVWNPQLKGNCWNLWQGYAYCFLRDHDALGQSKQRLRPPPLDAGSGT
ncbi:hypothetical protein F4810DRAFT_712991 [Camillea tinctor]|nr:hypothetical protein F4810DRAFT_712991 [Camillea tinctor]